MKPRLKSWARPDPTTTPFGNADEISENAALDKDATRMSASQIDVRGVVPLMRTPHLEAKHV
jgi:hypothetical protein